LTVHLLEVGVDLSRQQQVVEVLLLAGFLEGENALDNDEEDDSDREEVDLGAFVDFSFLNLGSHVRHGATVRLEGIDALVAGKAEIGDFEVEVVVDQDVFELQIAMYDLAFVHVVKGVKQLEQ
jgi:hypothetical protein